MARKRTIEVLKKNINRTGAKGPPKGSANHMLHGFYADLSSRNLDQRSVLARALRRVEGELVAAIGGDPTPQQRILIDRAVYKLARCSLFEASTFSDQPCNSDEKYLAWANSLRLDLQALGLERRARQVENLKSYLERNQRSPNGGEEHKP